MGQRAFRNTFDVERVTMRPVKRRLKKPPAENKEVKKLAGCWEVFHCEKKDCPAYKSKNRACWILSGTHCRNKIQGKFLEKMEMCVECKVFKANRDIRTMKIQELV